MPFATGLLRLVGRKIGYVVGGSTFRPFDDSIFLRQFSQICKFFYCERTFREHIAADSVPVLGLRGMLLEWIFPREIERLTALSAVFLR